MNANDGLPPFHPPIVEDSGVGLSVKPYVMVQLAMRAQAIAHQLHQGVQAGDPDCLRRVLLTSNFGAPVGALRRALDVLMNAPRRKSEIARWLE